MVRNGCGAATPGVQQHRKQGATAKPSRHTPSMVKRAGDARWQRGAITVHALTHPKGCRIGGGLHSGKAPARRPRRGRTDAPSGSLEARTPPGVPLGRNHARRRQNDVIDDRQRLRCRSCVTTRRSRRAHASLSRRMSWPMMPSEIGIEAGERARRRGSASGSSATARQPTAAPCRRISPTDQRAAPRSPTACSFISTRSRTMPTGSPRVRAAERPRCRTRERSVNRRRTGTACPCVGAAQPN